jgi:type II secretory pathway predicted ATPase ExeA/septal ring-binding cell division protein DamX
MYLEYYSLDRPPFRITPDPSLFFTGGANGRGVVLEALLYAVTSGEGILKVVGEVGSGKTMLCRMLEQRLPSSVEVVYLANPNLSPHDILYAIAFELKLPVDHNTQRLVLMQHLQEYLLKQHSANRTVLVIIEEAQSMPIETLEEVRLFSNLETHQHKLMQILLFGQPELDKNLQSKSIRQLRERITHSFYLRPLTVEETSAYIRFRLQAAGCPCPQVFSDAAEKIIAKASGGLTRRINILADKAMLAAYAESATTARPRTVDNLLKPAVLPKHVRAAIKDSEYESSPMTLPQWLLAMAVLVVLLAGGATWWQLRPVLTEPAVVEVVIPAALPPAAPPAVQAAAEPVVPPAADVVAEPDAAPPPAPQPASAPLAAAPEARPALTATPAVVDAPAAIDTPAVIETPAQIDTPAAFDTPAAIDTPVATDTPVAIDTPVATGIPATPQASGTQEAPAAIVEATAPAAVDAIASQLPASVAPVAPVESVPVAVQSGLLLLRTEATQQWLGSVQPDNYMVQMLSVNSSETVYVERFLRDLQLVGLLDDTYSCIANNQGRPFWKIVYGSFETVELARNFIAGLPLNVLSNRPFVQNIGRLECDEALQPGYGG